MDNIVLEEDVRIFAEQTKGKKLKAVRRDGSPMEGFEFGYAVPNGTYKKNFGDGGWSVMGSFYKHHIKIDSDIRMTYNNGFNFNKLDGLDEFCWTFIEEDEHKKSECWCGKDKFGFAGHMLSCPCFKPMNLKD